MSYAISINILKIYFVFTYISNCTYIYIYITNKYRGCKINFVTELSELIIRILRKL